MRFSYWANSEQPMEQILASARHAEATDWDGFWFADHFFSSYGDPLAAWRECWTTLTAVAATVPRLRIGSLVSSNTYRHPALTAKIATTLDEVSAGRVVLGVGAGWQENEHRAYGLHFGTAGERLDRLEEACEVLVSLLREQRTTFSGKHYELADAPMEPKGAHGAIPLLIGGGGERRTLRIVARFANEWNIWGTPDTLAAKSALLDQRCEEIGRDPSTIARSAVALLFLNDDEAALAPLREMTLPRPALVVTPTQLVEYVAAYREAGVGELIVPDFNLPDPNQRHEIMDQFQRAVAAAS